MRGPKKRESLRRAKLAFLTIFHFLHAFQAFSMTASPLDAVSTAEPLCTHGKDKPGLGAPNSLKLKKHSPAACNSPDRSSPSRNSPVGF